MKRTLAIAYIGYVLAHVGPWNAMGIEGPRSEAQLLNQFQTALVSKDKDSILSLFCWDGVPSDIRSSLNQGVSEALKQEVKGVKLLPLPPDFQSSFEEGSFRYSANIPVVGILKLEFARENNSPPTLPYGKKGEYYYLAGMKRERIASTNSIPAGTKTVAVHVQTANGNPLPTSLIVCGDPEKIPFLMFKTLFGGMEQFETDAQGWLSVPLMSTNLFLVVANDAGFGWLPTEGLTNNAIMTVQPWGRIEGTRLNRGHPVTDEHLSLSLDRDVYRFAVEPVHISGRDTWTDPQGRFVFEDVPPLKLFIDRQEKQRAYWGYFWSVEAKPGDTNKLEIKTRGRTVLGRVRIGSGLATNIDLATCSGALMSDKEGRDGSRCSVGFPVLADGSFHADRVEPGDYRITGDIRREGKLVALLNQDSVRVPDDDSAAADVPFDMGTVTLRPAVDLKPGDTAPDFTTITLDSKPLKLSNFLGKYVLLDFWATWCGPCVAETPNLKETYAAFGRDPRFVMISLSLDKTRDAPKRFALKHDITWVQGFLGDWSDDKVTQAYGVYGIPAIFLIGPDGKVVSKGLRGLKIKEAVETALQVSSSR